MRHAIIGQIGGLAFAVTLCVSLAIGCSSDPSNGASGARKGLLNGRSKVLDGPYDWPMGATLSAVSTGPTSALLSWPAPSGSSGVAQYRIYENGTSIGTVPGTGLTYELTGLTTGTSYNLAVQAEDGMGGATTDGPTTIYVAVTPSASSVASPIVRSVATAFGPATAFLYTGPDPVQRGVSTGTILPTLAAVVRGHIYARDGGGAPLAGVVVTVANHPEFGSTLSQADGEYDLAVNGGQTLRLHYELTDYLPVERLVRTPWQDYVTANDIALVQLDSQVTAIDVSSSSVSFQVAQGTANTDSSGTREATLLVPPGTSATMTLPDGSTSSLTTMSVRATEYSVGDSGNLALPADLPSTSAYAYSVELSADEALAAGATKVTFSQSLFLYVEDFLGWPAGTSVPSGYYDPSKGGWMASGNGIILQIVSVTGSEADVDVDGDGNADTGAPLSALGITDDERAQLASLYAVGQSLWRTPVGHFTADANGPDDGPPGDTPPAPAPCTVGAGGGACGKWDNPDYPCSGAESPCGEGAPVWAYWVDPADRDTGMYICCPYGYAAMDQYSCGGNTCDSPPDPAPPPDGPNNCQKENASTIACQRQSLGEDMALAGTPYSLHYESERQRGRQAQLNVPVSAILGGSPIEVDMTATVAGRVFTQSFSPSTFLNAAVTWDGRDGYGRLLQGAQPVDVQIHYQYSGVYQNAGGFGRNGTGTAVSSGPARAPYVIHKDWSSTIDFWDAQPEGLGGWTLNVHHTYDVAGRTIRYGDGTNRSLKNVPAVVRTFAGNGTSGTSGDGGVATAASVTAPQAVAVGADGTVYIADGQSCIRSVGTDGVIHTFAGQCHSPGFSGDGGAATSAQLQNPTDLALGPDGSLYIADTTNQRIRRVDPAGLIHTVVGSGAVGATAGTFSGDGGPASSATLDNPTGVDVGPDGTVYVADRDNGRIRQVTPDGVIATVAGNGPSSTSTGTGAAATAAGLGSPTKVRLGQDRSFYIAETAGNVVRRVGPDGLIQPVVGTGTAGYTTLPGAAQSAMLNAPLDLAFGPSGNLYVVDQNDVVQRVTPKGTISTVLGINGQAGFSNDNGLATAATIGTSQGLRLGPDGSLYVASSGDNRVRRIDGPFGKSATAGGGFQFPSEDGTQVFVFDATGRHQQTVDALTGAALYSFSYDAGGRLASVTDVSGNVTQFSHDGSGNPTTVVTPYGQTWTLGVDANGYLAGATDPATETTQFTYDANGLMQTKTDVRGGLSQYSYDSVGRLTLDQDAAGGSTSLALSQTAQGTSVTLTTGLGVQTTLATSLSTNGTFIRSNTFSTLAQGSFTLGPISSTVVEPGMTATVTTTQAPDPRSGFGMLSPVDTVTTTLPSGLASTQTNTRSVTYSGSDLATFTEQTNVNGNTWTRLFNAAAHTWTTTSPVGRTSTTTVDAAARPSQIAIPNVAATSFAYDGHGRLSSVAQGSHTTTQTYDANGFLASITDALSHTTSYTNDALGRPTLEVLPDGRQIGTTYDGAGNATQITLPSTASHAFSFTPVELVSTYTPPSLSSASPATQYAYDVDRDLTGVTEPGSVAITYGYDSNDWRTSTTYPQGTLYTGYNNPGTLSYTTTPSGETTYFWYDGRVLTGTSWSGPVSGALTLGFDTNFRMTTQSINSVSLPFGYDADGLLTNAGDLTLSLDSQNGHLTGTTLGSMTDAYTYDANGRLATYTAQYGGTTLYSESVTRDAIGRITQKTETVQGTTHVWGYTFDATGRLTDVTEDSSFFSHYGYDADDNRTTYTNTSGTVSPTYDAQDRLLTYGSASYTYTDNGELTGKTDGSGSTSYTYDALGNLLDVTPPSGTPIDYVVDGQNRRVGKEVSGTLTTGFLYQNALNIVAQLDGSGNLVARYVFGSKPNVPDYFTTSSGTFRIVSDHLGSPRLVVDTSSGTVVDEIDYDEFGVVTNDAAPGTIPFGFAGGEYDADTGLVRFGARDYDASVGRWTAKDPTRFDGGTNLYGYAYIDPINDEDFGGDKPTPDSCEGACYDIGQQAFHACTAGGILCSKDCHDIQNKSYAGCLQQCYHPPLPKPVPPPAPPPPRPCVLVPIILPNGNVGTVCK